MTTLFRAKSGPLADEIAAKNVAKPRCPKNRFFGAFFESTRNSLKNRDSNPKNTTKKERGFCSSTLFG